MPLKLFTETGVFPQGNVQVTFGTTKQARSESVIAVNPRDHNNLIAASKKFTDPQSYRFVIGVRVSLDGGSSWRDATLPTLPEWGPMVDTGGPEATTGMTDPAAAFDDFGNAFLVGEPIRYRPQGVIDTVGMYIYRSTDGGRNWSTPVPLHVGDLTDDKSWIACDNNPASPHYGNVYIAWGAASPLRFARSTDHGAHWKGVGNNPAGTALANVTEEPEISVGLDGTVHVVWCDPGNTAGTGTIRYLRSTDGGNSFQAEKEIVSGVHSLSQNLPQTDGWPHLPGASFRVLTIATACGFGPDDSVASSALQAKKFVVAWSDFREGAARIYYRISSDGGASFDGPQSGQPLLGPRQVDPSLHHFHPQIVATGTGILGCAYYEYGPKRGSNLIDVVLSASFDQGQTFPKSTNITDKPWDPAIDAPWSHGDQAVTFIGEYFGLDADQQRFHVLWTDTRTGVQELFYSRVDTARVSVPEKFKGISADVLIGILQDGGGIYIINGHLGRVPPRGPVFELAQAMAALDVAGKIGGRTGRILSKNVYNAIAAIAQTAGESLKE